MNMSIELFNSRKNAWHNYNIQIYWYSRMPPYCLQLKISSTIILLRNINPPKLRNGIRLAVKKINGKCNRSNHTMWKSQSEDVLIPRIPLIPTGQLFEFKRLQFPVRLAFAKHKDRHWTYAESRILVFLIGNCMLRTQELDHQKNLYIFTEDGKTKKSCVFNCFELMLIPVNSF